MTPDEQAIRKLIDDWQAAAEAGEVDRMATFLGPDCTFLTAGNPPMSGTQYIEGSRHLHAACDLKVSGEILAIRISGDLAVCHQHLNVRFTPKGGGAVTELDGPTLLVFERAVELGAGAPVWRLWRDANLVQPVK